jgi:hypothetical protein
MQKIPQIVRDFGAIALGGYIGESLRKMAPIRYNKRRNMPYPTPRTNRVLKYRSSAGSTTSRGRMSYNGSTSHNSVVTRQKDYGSQYRYKKMPRYKKRRWRSFVKKVAAVQLKQAGLRTVLFNSRVEQSNPPGYQGAFNITLYGINGSQDGVYSLGLRDIYRIFKNDPDVVQIGTPPGNVPKSGKLQFGSGVLDLTIRNLSADIEAEVDVYYGWFKKDDDQVVTLSNTNPIYKYNLAPIDLINATNNAININERGATLFDKPAGISAIGYHITKKMKMLLAPGQSTFLQHRDAKNYMVDWTNVQDCGFAKRGLTFGMFVVYKPSVTASDDAVVTLAIGATRKYSYAVVEDNVDRIALNPPN